jgi:uncharacterized membrane protein YadS
MIKKQFFPGWILMLLVGIVATSISKLVEVGGRHPTEAVVIAIIVVTMALSFFVIYFLGKAFKLPRVLAILLSVGTTICGGSAIAITAPLNRAKEEKTSCAIGTIALWG